MSDLPLSDPRAHSTEAILQRAVVSKEQAKLFMRDTVYEWRRYRIVTEKWGLASDGFNTIAEAMASVAEQMRNAMVCGSPFAAEVLDCLRPNHPKVVVIMGDFCDLLTHE